MSGMQRAQQYAPVKYSVTRLGGGQTQTGVSFPGGFDQTTPTLALQPGALRDVSNFEVAQSGGYARIVGYERVDGRAAPSDATYIIVQVSSFVNVPAVGQAISQANSVATGTVAAVNNVAGAYYMVVTQTAGVFNATDVVSAIENLTVTAANSPFTVTAANSPYSVSFLVTIGTAIAQTAAITSQLDAQYLANAADIYRTLIGAVPGTGNILGVVGMIFNGVDNVYAFRANVAGNAVALYKASTAGWTLVPFFNTVDFTAGGTAIPLDGDTLTQGGVTATIKRVMWQSGSFTGGTAVGTFVVTTPTGGSFTAGAATTTSGATVTLSGIQTPITLSPGGRFEFVKANFSGQLVTRRIYGCDGINKAFEFDGVTLAPITTGLSPDNPSHIWFHKNFLFVSQGSSIFYCGVGTPFKWGSVDGGGEIATGDAVTAMITLPGSQTTATLAVYLRSNTAFLYGTDPSTFNYVTFNTGLGALPYTAQNLFDTFVMDDLGVINLRTTLNWGNFLPSYLTKNILPFIEQERTKVTASTLMRGKSQYRLFFSDGFGLWITMINQQYLGAGVVQFPNPVHVCDEGEDSNGAEIEYFGSNDGLGYVYQFEKGTSFDGANIDAHITLNWDPIKSPRLLKRFRAASIEIASDSYAQVIFGYQLGYGSTNIGTPADFTSASNFSSVPKWDTMVWDKFTWDGQTLLPTDVDMTGTGENVQVTIKSTTNYIAAYQLNSVIYHYSMRRGLRV